MHQFLTKNDKLPSGVSTLKQIHSDIAVYIAQPTFDEVEADAMVTDVSGIALGIKTADCAPVLFDAGKVVAAAHAGWRGAVGGVLESTIELMLEKGAELKNIKAYVGPCIHQKSYEVGEDFINNLKDEDRKFVKNRHFDLPGYVMYRLKKAGVNAIEVSDVDTFADENYFSYRRGDKDKGCRQFSIISID